MFECVKVVYNALASKTSSELWRSLAGATIVSGVYSLILYLTVSTKSSSVDALHHERGHNWQLMMMGIGTFGFTVGIPSFAKLGECDKTQNYYGAPWETMADILGGVKGGTHSSTEIRNAWSYYILSTFCLPFVVLYWI